MKLYELRREEKMRQARDWFFAEFHPESFEEYKGAMFGAQGAFLRMVVSYWEMAAALVNHGAIDLQMFDDTNGEHIAVFAKVEPFLGDVRAMYGPQFLAHLEQLIGDSKNGRERAAMTRERMKSMRADMMAARAKGQTV